MTFPAPPAHEIEKNRKEREKQEAKIAALKLEVDRLKNEAFKPRFLSAILPRPVETWVKRRLLGRATAAAIEAAQENVDWATYDMTARRRPLYPRKRNLSNPGKRVDAQAQSVFFARLPGEIRRAVYRVLLTGFRVEILAQHGGYRGPKGSEGRFVLSHCRMQDGFGRVNQAMMREQQAPGIAAEIDIIPLLQSCRRVYLEAIDMLYQENFFFTRRDHLVRYMTKYLLQQRLESIQHLECVLEIGYPWHVMHNRLTPIAEMRGLKRLKIEGLADGIIDGHEGMNTIDAALWGEKKDQILPYLREIAEIGIEEMDVFLPIAECDLSEEDGFGKHRIRGLAGSK